MTDEQVLTPGGPRPQSQVHRIEPGTVLDASDGRLRQLHAEGHTLAEFGTVPAGPDDRPLMPDNVAHVGEPTPALGNGWITYASWRNSTGTPISQFTTIWEVPPEPATRSGQTVFLFNGIQNSTRIYQPVLQWGPSAAGGGNYWTVASWYVGGGDAFHSDLVRVNVGDVLIGVMTLTGESTSGASYSCGFFGIANSGLPIQNVEELTWLIETLECYGMTQCSDYPATNRTTMVGIDVKQGSGRPPLMWSVNDAVSDCGQHTVVHDTSPDGGSVDLWYGPAPRIDDVVLWNNGKAYLLHGSQYVRYDVATDRTDPGYPLPIAGNWPGLPATFTNRVDAVVMWNNGKAYLFKGNKYVRYDVATDRTDPGYPLRIGGHWPGFPPVFEASVDAGVMWNNGKAYFFKGNQYIRYDLAADRTDPGYPLPIAGYWPGLTGSFVSSIDAVVLWNNGKAYLIKGHEYVRYDVAADRADPGYPLPIAGNWPGLPPDFT